jgi:hypothetical protein
MLAYSPEMMPGRIQLVLLAWLAAACAACSGGGGDPCAGKVCDSPPPDSCQDANTLLVYAQTGSCDPASGECTYDVSERDCLHGCEAGSCKPPPPGDLELTIPDGTSLCTIWGWGGDSVRDNWEGKGRVTLNAGTIVFPKDQAEVPADPVAAVEAWPGVGAEPVAGSAFLRTVEEQGGVELHTYELVQEFAYQDRTFQVALAVEYEFEGGAARDPVVVLDDPTLYECNRFQGRFGENWSQIPLVSCNFEYLEERVRTIRVENGDRITFWMRGREEEFTWPQPSMVFTFELVKTRFERGSQVREVADFFDLSSSMNHHGCCPGYLANFDQPVGDVHLIWIDEFSYGWVVHYVDADGQEIENSPYVDAP